MSNRWNAEIRNELMRRHMRQGELARSLGISDQYLSDMLCGNRSMSTVLALKVEKAIGISRDLYYACSGIIPPDLMDRFSPDDLVAMFEQQRRT